MRVLFSMILSLVFSLWGMCSDAQTPPQDAYGFVLTSPTSSVNAPTAFFRPASLQKILVFAAASKVLGPAYVMKTELWTMPSSNQLVLHMNGDPTLTLEEFDQLLAKAAPWVKAHPRVQVTIAMPPLSFADYAPGLMVDDMNSCYAMPVSMLMINGNYVVYHRKKDSDPFVQKGWEALDLPNGVLPTEMMERQRAHHERLYGAHNGKHMSCIALSPQEVHKAFPGWVATLLTRHYPTTQFDVTYGSLPSNATLLAAHHSKPFAQLGPHMMIHSDNLLANRFFIATATALEASDGWEQGGKAIAAFLEASYGVSLQGARVMDGAGLSHYNSITPVMLYDLLHAMQKDPVVGPSALASFPLAGVEGTLKKRIKDVRLHKSFRAKTGSITGSFNLAGYLQVPSGWVPFVTMMTGFPGGLNAHIPHIEEKLHQRIAAHISGAEPTVH